MLPFNVASGKRFCCYVPYTQVRFPALPNPKFGGKTGCGVKPKTSPSTPPQSRQAFAKNHDLLPAGPHVASRPAQQFVQSPRTLRRHLGAELAVKLVIGREQCITVKLAELALQHST